MKTDDMCRNCVFYNRKKKFCQSREAIKNHADCIKILSRKIELNIEAINYLKFYSSEELVDEYDKYYKESDDDWYTSEDD